MLLPFAREYLMDQYSGVMMDNIEADDVMGIMMTKDPDAVIVSKDKDLLTIPGNHYRIHKPEDGIISVSVEDADRFFYCQCLTGDTTDGYGGIKGVGPKKAEKVLSGCSTKAEYWAAIVGAYINAGLTEDDALVTARLARILRAEDHDGTSPILFDPYS